MCQALFYRELRNLLCLSALVLLLFSSCRSTRQFVSPLPEEYTVRMSRSSASGYKNVKRVRQYEFAHRDVPAAFNGCRLAFISDLHYRSLLKKEGLEYASAKQRSPPEQGKEWATVRSALYRKDCVHRLSRYVRHSASRCPPYAPADVCPAVPFPSGYHHNTLHNRCFQERHKCPKAFSPLPAQQ